MLTRQGRTVGVASIVAMALSVGLNAAPEAVAPRESQRLAQAKDLIAEEQYTRAIEVLRAAARDPKEPGRDEAIYWLARSMYHAGDSAGALESIRRLEREFPASLWTKPAAALRLEVAVRLGRNDVLWWTAVPQPSAVTGHIPTPPRPAPRAERSRPARVPAPPEPPLPAVPATAPLPPRPQRPPSVWLPEGYHPDIDLRVQALGHLIHFDAERVIPVLKEIALEAQNPGPASRAVFVLAQSGKPEARETVVLVAKTGPEPVRLAAVRELGRFGGPEISKELLQVYSIGEPAIKLQVVKALGERSDQPALLTIVRSEKDADLRARAILTLGRAGGTEPLLALYKNASGQVKRAIIRGLFNAPAENELIQIARQERDATLRNEVHSYLGMLGTPKAREYLQKIGRNR